MCCLDSNTISSASMRRVQPGGSRWKYAISSVPCQRRRLYMRYEDDAFTWDTNMRCYERQREYCTSETNKKNRYSIWSHEQLFITPCPWRSLIVQCSPAHPITMNRIIYFCVYASTDSLCMPRFCSSLSLKLMVIQYFMFIVKCMNRSLRFCTLPDIWWYDI